MIRVVMVGVVGVMFTCAVAAETGRLVSPIKDQKAIDGCSWSASASSLGQGVMFLAEYDESRILMNIDGEDFELTLVSRRGSLRTLGEVAERTFRSGDVTVKARYRVTWVCPKDEESCEVTRFSASFDVSKGSRTQHVEAMGDVGC